MKVEYLVCDTCEKKIDFEAGGDRAAGKIEIARIRMTLGNMNVALASLSPFRTEKVAELATKEIVEKTYIDLCEKCTKQIEDLCVSLRNKNIKSSTTIQ